MSSGAAIETNQQETGRSARQHIDSTKSAFMVFQHPMYAIISLSWHLSHSWLYSYCTVSAFDTPMYHSTMLFDEYLYVHTCTYSTTEQTFPFRTVFIVVSFFFIEVGRAMMSIVLS